MIFKVKNFNIFYYHEEKRNTRNLLLSDFFLRDLGINKFIFKYLTLILEIHNSDYFFDLSFTERSYPNSLYIGNSANFFLSKKIFLHDVFFWNFIKLIKIKHIKAFNVKKGLPFTSKRTHFGNKNSRKTLTLFKDFMPKKENNIKLIINKRKYQWR